MNAVVMAGGFGSRLMPLTANCPKPMVKIAGRPMLDYTVAQLYAHGISEMVFTLGYMPDVIRDYVEGYENIDTFFTVEDVPLGTAGGVKAAEVLLDERFFVLSGDALSDINLSAMLNQHIATGAKVTLAAAVVDDPKRFGVLSLDSSNCVKGFIEKPQSDAFGKLVNTGVYIIEKSVLGFVPKNMPFDFARDLFPMLTESGSLYAYVHDGYWSDIGTINSYFDANMYMREGTFFPFVPHIAESDFAAYNINGCLVSDMSLVTGRAKNSVIESGAMITSSGYTEDCVVLSGAVVKSRKQSCIVGADFELCVNGKVTNFDEKVTGAENISI